MSENKSDAESHEKQTDQVVEKRLAKRRRPASSESSRTLETESRGGEGGGAGGGETKEQAVEEEKTKEEQDEEEEQPRQKHLLRLRQLGLLPSVWASRPAWRRVTNIEKDYELVSVLGSGASAVVLLANDLAQPGHPPVVLKVYSDSVESRDPQQAKWSAEQSRQAEVETLVALYRASGEQGHPNVMSYLDAFVWAPQEDDADTGRVPTLLLQAASDAMLEGETVHEFPPAQEYTVLVLDYIPGIDMFQYYVDVWESDGLNTTPMQVRGFLHDALAGLAFMHALGFAHRDVKPENMYIWRPDDNSNALRVMLLDMGFACHLLFETDRTKHALGCKTRPSGGTVSYMSPEFAQTLRQGASPLRIEQWMASDIWALALSIVLVATGQHPNEAVASQAGIQEVIQELLDYNGPREIIYAPNDPGLDRLLRRMLAADWRRRPTAVEALQILASLPAPTQLSRE